MTPDESFDMAEWPELPADKRGLQIPHDGKFGEASQECLRSRGYDPVDIRFLSGAEAIKLSLQGARMGTVNLGTPQLKALELEARICGLVGTKTPDVDTGAKVAAGQSAYNTLSALLPDDVVLVDLRKKQAGGRPKGINDKVPRARRKGRLKKIKGK